MKSCAMPYFIMTVDLDPPPPSTPNLRVDIGAIRILRILKKYDVKSTFFVTATVAESFPRLMQNIVNEGHEIACHDLDHSPNIQKFDATNMIRRIRKATDIIATHAGVRPVGYRAPLFKISRNQLIALWKNNYVYDSSFVCSPFYGFHRTPFPPKPFYIHLGETFLIEIPLFAGPILPFPIGGSFIRIFGKRWAKLGVKSSLLLKFPLIFYIHPKDVIPRTNGPYWYSYRNTGICAKHLEEVILYAQRQGVVFMRAIDLANIFTKM
jgi:peptidoglycan/xylan/chitin deacetylase (PgdA/CDA1 family)